MAPEQIPATGEKPIFSRIINADDISAARVGHIKASEAERVRLAALYKVESIASLTFDYILDTLPSQRYRLTGDIKGELTQLCGVTLEPVVELIDEAVSVEYWPERHIARVEPNDNEPAELLESDPPEPIVGGKIDLGKLAAEVFSTAINPYPRKDGVSFEWSDAETAEAETAAKPFAALSRLKDKR